MDFRHSGFLAFLVLGQPLQVPCEFHLVCVAGSFVGVNVCEQAVKLYKGPREEA